MVITSKNSKNKELEIIKEISGGVSDLLSGVKTFRVVAADLIREYYNPIRRNIQKSDGDFRFRKFLKECIDGGPVKHFIGKTGIDDFLSTGNVFSKELNKLLNSEIVWDCNISKLKLVEIDSFSGFDNYRVTTFVTNREGDYLEKESPSYHIIEYLVCEDDELDEKIELLVNSIKFSNLKNRAKTSMKYLYDGGYKNVYLDSYSYSNSLYGFPLSLYRPKIHNNFMGDLEKNLLELIFDSLKNGLNDYTQYDYIGMAKALFLGEKYQENIFSKNIAVKRFLSEFDGFEYLKPERDEVIKFCKTVIYSPKMIKTVSKDDPRYKIISRSFQYLFKTYDLELSELLTDDNLKDFIQRVVSFNAIYIPSSPRNLVEYVLKSISGGYLRKYSILDYDDLTALKSLRFLLDNKPSILEEIGNFKNSIFKNPVLCIHTRRNETFQSLKKDYQLNLYKINEIVNILKGSGVVAEKPIIKFYFGNKNKNGWNNTFNYNADVTLSTLKLLINEKGLDYDIQLVVSEKSYNDYIHTFFSENELSNISILKLKDFDEYILKTEKARNTSDFDIDSIVKSSIYELTWMKQLLK
jgi:hypothetical protein